MKKFFIYCLLILPILSVAETNNETRPLTEKEIQLIKEKMETELLDAESARYKFPDRILVKNGKSLNGIYCGLVNSKNSYGAYTGYSAFSTMFHIRKDNGETGLVLMFIDKGDGSVFATCREEGYRL